MSDWLLQLYHRLPGGARSLAVSLRGFYLRRSRFGPETESWVQEGLAHESWSLQRMAHWQQEELAKLLQRAATRVPYYREQWAQRRRCGDRASWEHLENWPVLEKEPLRDNPRAFLADDCTVRRMFAEHTSGTTGKPLELWRSRETVRRLYALSEARERRWFGVSYRDRWCMLGGQIVAPANRRQPPFWVWNRGMNQLYMSSYHLAPDLIGYGLDALVRYRIQYVFGYTSSLYALAQELQHSGRPGLKMAVALTNAEPVFDYQRQLIAAAFQCPVRQTYGMSEIVTLATECPAGQLHLWPEAGITEVLDGDRPVPRGTCGDLVCTGLLNKDMPLIRYRVGDRGTLAASDSSCACGRRLPVLAAVEGRSDDVLYTADGRRVGRLDPVFKARLPVREAQIVQETLGRIRVRYAPLPGFTAHSERSIIDRLRARMGQVEVVLEEVAELPRTSNGKFRAVICNLSAGQRQQLDRSV